MSGTESLTLELWAPVTGLVVSLDEVPDEAFRQRLVGEGVAIEPLGDTLCAPCDATVLHVHRARHALTLDADGLEIVLHLGLETVRLDGVGLEPLVQAGTRVRRGQPLLRFSPDAVAAHATSLLTPLVIPPSSAVARVEPVYGAVTSGAQVVLRVHRVAAPPAGGIGQDAVTSQARLHSGPMFINDPIGLHARPAAMLAAVARRFVSALHLVKDGREANLRSVVSLMALEVGGRDAVTVVARGEDAAAAVAAITELLVPVAAAPDAAGPRRADFLREGVLHGVGAASGLAVGTIVQLRHDDRVEPQRAADAHAERRALDAAVAAAHLQLEVLRTQLIDEGHAERATIFAAHLELLADPDLMDRAALEIHAGWSAAWAWHEAYVAQAGRLAALRDPLLAARATDLRDVGRRVLHLLHGRTQGPPPMPEAALVIAEDLTPSEAASLDRTRVKALCTTMGSATSHVAIIARGLGLPAIAGLDARALDVPDGTRALVDGDAGHLHLSPTATQEAAATARRAADASRRAAAHARAQEPAVTRDGQRIEVAANVGNVRDAGDVVAAGADGVGLLRSEFIFQARDREPSEDEQASLYGSIASGLGPDRLLIVRTLDVGGDKPLPYLPMAAEENPFLGERGIRFTLAHPEVMRRQVRAVLRAALQGRVALMFPMIATLGEWRVAAAMVEAEREALGAPRIPVGIMVETAAAAVLAERFARAADFVSLGTNDLTQYTLAMDRTNPRLAPQVDALHPAVLRLIALTAQGARQHGRWAGVCGALAAEPAAIPVLLGLGITELSVDLPLVALTKARVRGLDLAACRETAAHALECADGTEVRALVAARHGEEH